MARKRKPQQHWFIRTVRFIARLVLVLLVIGLVVVLIVLKQVQDAYILVRDNIEQIADIEEVPKGSQATRIYARDFDLQNDTGTLLGQMFEQNRQQVDFVDMPPMFVTCVLSTEDARFFEHRGVDLIGLGRAAYNILQRREVRGGGSTITQQLSRNVFLPYIKSEKTMNRKVQEVILSFALEKRFSKQEILEAYCNHIFFGSNAYGVKSAAQTYFNKELADLTLAESALLAGLPQLPTSYNPRRYPEKAKSRRDDVLRLLRNRLDTEFFAGLAETEPELFGEMTITRAMIDEALAEPIVLSEYEATSAYLEAEYFTSYLVEYELDARYGADQIRRQGYRVVTTIDPLYQRWAEEIVKEKIDENREAKHVSQGALILLEAATGEVLACVGGYEWLHPTDDGSPDMYNRALQGGRPVGSSFKPFTYATAYEQGFPASMLIWDGPNKEITEKKGKAWPMNSDMTYRGWVSMFWGLQMSRNAASVDLLVNCTGGEQVIETARKMGITSELLPVPALTLGYADIRPVEMAGAFATFPNVGEHIDYILLKKIYNQNGIIQETQDLDVHSRTNRAFSENTAWTMVQNMLRVVEAGTGTNARVRNVELIAGDGKTTIQIAGKTGTNDDFADAWFVGYSPELVCAVWVGNDDYADQMKRVFGGDLPARIFQTLMSKVYSCQYETIGEGENAVDMLVYEPRYTQRKFEKPAGVTFNGFPAADVGEKLIKDEEGEWLEPDAEPTEDEDAEGSDGESDGNDNSDFYQQWEPPPQHEVYF